MMKEIDIDKWGRKKQYEWFKKFSNPCYDLDVKMDVTKLVEYSKERKQSFFINMLYIVVKGLNSIDEMRMRLVNDKPVIYDDINPAYTVMTNSGVFENVRHKNYDNYNEFYSVVEKTIKSTKEQTEIKDGDYNPKECWNEYYITCLPWVNFSHTSQPISDNKSFSSIPIISWSKYTNNNDKYELTLSITVSHMFVDGYPLSKTFLAIQELLDNVENILK